MITIFFIIIISLLVLVNYNIGTGIKLLLKIYKEVDKIETIIYLEQKLKLGKR